MSDNEFRGLPHSMYEAPEFALLIRGKGSKKNKIILTVIFNHRFFR